MRNCGGSLSIRSSRFQVKSVRCLDVQIRMANAGIIAAIVTAIDLIDFGTDVDEICNELKQDNLQSSAARCRGKRFTNSHPQDSCSAQLVSHESRVFVKFPTRMIERCWTSNNFVGQPSTKARCAAWHRRSDTRGYENAGVVSQRTIALCPLPDGFAPAFAFKTGIECPRSDSSNFFLLCAEKWMTQQTLLAIQILRRSGPSAFG